MKPALLGFSIVMVLFLCAPVLVVSLISFDSSAFMRFPPQQWSLRWYAAFLTSPEWLGPAALSLKIALATAASALLLGGSAAIGLERGGLRARRAIELFLLSPMVVPVVVLALGLYFLFSGWHVLGSPVALWLGHTVIATPLVIVLTTAALRTTDATLDLAARSLGATHGRALWHVTLPTIRPALLSAAAFAFLVSFDDVVIAIFVGGPDAVTLPKRMWETIRFEIDPTLTVVSTLLTLVAALLMLVAQAVRRRR